MAKIAVKKCKNVQVRKLNLGVGLKPKDIKMMRSHANNPCRKASPVWIMHQRVNYAE